MVRMTKEDRETQLRAAVLSVAKQVGYKAITREQVADYGNVSAGLVSKVFGDMDMLKQVVLHEGCASGNLPLIIEGVLHRDPLARRTAKKYKDAIINLLFK